MIPGDAGFAQHIRRAHAAGVITDAERHERCRLEWAVVRARGIDDLRDCVDGAGHEWEPAGGWVDPHEREWQLAECGRCAVGTLRLVDEPERSTEAFVDLLAQDGEHRRDEAG